MTEESTMEYVVTDDDKEYIRTYVADAPNDQIKKDRRKECASVFGLSLPQVAAITAHTVIRAKKAAALLLNPEVVVEAPIEQPEPVIEVENEMPPGTAMDYDNPIKQKYRTMLKNFIVKVFPTVEERKTKKVLCLPGRKCLEAHIYLDLGFLPQNIVGVEGEPTAFREFLHNASELGISVRTCDLDRVVDEQEWDISNLDFTGPIKQKVLDLLANVRLNTKNKCVFGLNLLGQRESDAAQQIIDQYYATVLAAKNIADHCNNSFIEALEAQNAHRDRHQKAVAEGERVTDIYSPGVDIGTQRDAAIPMAVWHKLAKNFSPLNRVSPAPKMPEQYQNNQMVQMFVDVFFRGLWREFHENQNLTIECAASTSHKIMLLYEIAMAPRHICTGVEQYSYVSPSHQKYLTDFYVMEFARPHGSACDEIIAFVNSGLEGLALLSTEEKHSWRFQMRRRNGHVFLRSVRVSNSDTLEFVIDDKVRGRLKMRSMFAGLERVAHMVARDMTLRTTHGEHKYERIAL